MICVLIFKSLHFTLVLGRGIGFRPLRLYLMMINDQCVRDGDCHNVIKLRRKERAR